MHLLCTNRLYTLNTGVPKEIFFRFHLPIYKFWLRKIVPSPSRRSHTFGKYELLGE